MNIVKKETIELSAEEKNAFDLISKVLEGIVRGADDPVLIDDAVDLNSMLLQFYIDYCLQNIIQIKFLYILTF